MAKKLVVHSIDIDGDFLEDWVPENIYGFECVVTICIGFEGDDGGIFFHLNVASIIQMEKVKSGTFLSRILVLEKYEPKTIIDYINKIVNANKFATWEEALEFLSFYFSNEYFNYNSKHVYV
ncbi:MAG: immunity 8 family protein [Beijerinckiaceae bacterium]|nr:immunity 8 family protein [Beijerinckiaceae bacterium]